MSIKDILERHNKEKEAYHDVINEEQNKLQNSEEKAKHFITQVIDKAFQNIKTEFDTSGDKKLAIIDTKTDSFYSAITVVEDQIKEFYYELNVHLDETAFWIKVVHHFIKKNGTFDYVPEYTLHPDKPLAELTEADIRQDFYQKYEQFLIAKTKY